MILLSSKISDKQKVLNLFLLFIILFPLLPIFMGDSQIHVNVFSILMSMFFIMLGVRKVEKGAFIFVVILFILFQLLLIFTYIFGKGEHSGLSDLLSLLRPSMLLIVLTFFIGYLSDIKTSYDSYNYFESLIKLIKFTVAVMFIWAVLEVFFTDFISPLMHSLYKRSYKADIGNSAVTFFGLTYYSGYVAFVFLNFLMAKFLIERSLYNFSYVVMVLLLVVLSQSKLMIISSFIAIGIMIGVRGIPSIIFYLVTLGGAITWIAFNIQSVLMILGGINAVSARSASQLISNPEESGTLQVRLGQIQDTYETIIAGNPFIGIGLGKDIYLESWIAEVMYRYGLIGVGLFLVLSITLSLMCYKMFRSIKNRQLSMYSKALMTWSALLPMTQLSSYMFETSKMAILSMFLISLTLITFFAFIRRRAYE